MKAILCVIALFCFAFAFANASEFKLDCDALCKYVPKNARASCDKLCPYAKTAKDFVCNLPACQSNSKCSMVCKFIPLADAEFKIGKKLKKAFKVGKKIVDGYKKFRPYLKAINPAFPLDDIQEVKKVRKVRKIRKAKRAGKFAKFAKMTKEERRAAFKKFMSKRRGAFRRPRRVQKKEKKAAELAEIPIVPIARAAYTGYKVYKAYKNRKNKKNRSLSDKINWPKVIKYGKKAYTIGKNAWGIYKAIRSLDDAAEEKKTVKRFFKRFPRRAHRGRRFPIRRVKPVKAAELADAEALFFPKVKAAVRNWWKNKGGKEKVKEALINLLN